ncbi:hypothetical protein [Kitasatospora sp. NE20-6]|uniref:hypothetical protein n=1 Tax=Kitasatospora sp. NE20-6 TaxID=2859066 RepID=UPI0038B3703D
MRNAPDHPAARPAAHADAPRTAAGPRHRSPVARAVRNVGIMLDTAARVVLLGRDGVAS